MAERPSSKRFTHIAMSSCHYALDPLLYGQRRWRSLLVCPLKSRQRPYPSESDDFLSISIHRFPGRPGKDGVFVERQSTTIVRSLPLAWYWNWGGADANRWYCWSLSGGFIYHQLDHSILRQCRSSPITIVLGVRLMIPRRQPLPNTRKAWTISSKRSIRDRPWVIPTKIKL